VFFRAAADETEGWDIGGSLWVVDSDGNNARQIETGEVVPSWWARWSPDGSKILFATARAQASGALWTVNPDGSILAKIVEIALEYRYELPADPDSKALEEFLLQARAADPMRFPDLSLAVIKLLGSGEYIAEPPDGNALGRFGLAVKDYAHSTAPNRRYPDLLTQRLLKAALAGKTVPYSKDELDELAAHCTEAEDAATKVERRVEKSAAAILLESRIGEKFDAIVTGASEKGTWVRLLSVPVEGKVVDGFEGLEVGEQVRVQLIDTNIEQGYIDFKKVSSHRHR